jgi:hypothetical protein
MKKSFLLITALLLLPAIVAAPAQGEEREGETAPLQYRRILAPADRISDWPTGDGKYLPLETKEFERLLALLKAAGDSVPVSPTAQLRRVEYRAALEGDHLLSGNAELEIAITAEPPVMLPLAPCNLSIRNPRWAITPRPSGENIANSPRPLGEGPGVRATSGENPPLPNALQEVEGNQSPKALLGATPQGKLGVVAEHSGKLQIDFSLTGHREPSGNLIFSGEIPSAATSSLILDLPEELIPQIEKGWIINELSQSPGGESSREGEAPADPKELPQSSALPAAQQEPRPPEIANPHIKRWRIELGGNNRFQLKLISNTPQGSTAAQPLFSETRMYDLSPRGVDVSAIWKIQNRPDSAQQITVLLDPGLELVAARCGETTVAWTLEPLPNNQGERATVSLPPSASAASRTLRLSAIAPLVMDHAWRLPRIRPEGVTWEEGIIGIAAVRPLSIERFNPVECSQSATISLAAPRIGESAQFRSFNADATVELSLALDRGEVSATVATAVEIGGGEISAHVTGEFRSVESSQFTLEAEVAPAWRIDEVTSVPPEAIADWNLEAQPDGNRRLTIRLAKSIGPEQPLGVIVSARRLRLPAEHGLKFRDLQPLRYLPPVESRRWLSLRAIGRNELKIRGNDQPRRLLLRDIPSAEKNLFSDDPEVLLFAEDAADSDAEAVVESRRPEYSAAIQMEAEARGDRLQESWHIRCVPTAAQVEKIIVRLSEKSETPPRWKISGAEGLALTARPLPTDDEEEHRSEDNAETWEIVLSRPQNRPFELHGSRETVFAGPRPLSLASLPEASRQNGTLVIRRNQKTELRIENRRLKCLPPEPPSLESYPTAWATYSYDPARDASYTKEPSISIVPAEQLMSSACAWSMLLESWHEPEGLSRYVAVWELQLGDRSRARITLPAGVDPSEVSGVWIDDRPAVWQPIIEVNATSDNADTSKISVTFPAEKRFALLAVEFAMRDKPLRASGSVVSRLPVINMPVLSSGWRMWLPAGYEIIEGQAAGSPAFTPRPTIGRCLWGPLGREADQRSFRIFSAEDWAAIAGDPSRRHSRKNLEKIIQILGQSLDHAASGKKNAPVLWRNILEQSAEWSSTPRLIVDRLALDRLGVSGQTPLTLSVEKDATPRIEEQLQKARLALLVSGDSVLLTSQVSAAIYSRQWSASELSVAGILSPGPLANRMSEASQDEAEGRFLPARIWAQLPPKPESPWDRGVSRRMIPYELHGWNAARRGLSLQYTVSMGYIHRPTFQIAGLVTFLAVAAIGWCFLLRRLLVLLLLSGVFAFVALVISEPYAALASWAMLGTLFCMILRLVIRPRATDVIAIHKSPSSASKSPLPVVLESTVFQTEGWPHDASKGSNSGSVVKLLLLATVLTSASQLLADEPAKKTTAAPASPVYRVFVPTDAAKKPVGDKVYVPESFYTELYRRAGAVSEKPQGWLLTAAVYRGALVRESATGQMTIDTLKAQFDLHTFSRAVRVQIPFQRENANLVAENVLLDGRPLRAEWDALGTALSFTIDEPGDYRLELPLQPAMRNNNSGAGFDISLPRLAGARLELVLPSDPPVVDVPSALGKVVQESEPPRIVADLGPTDRLTVSWQDVSPGAAVAEIDELIWLKVQPGSVLFDVRLKGNAIAGQLKKLQLAVDPRLRLQPFTGVDAPTVQMQSLPDQPQIITLEWPQPLPEQTLIGLSFLMTGASGVGNLRLPLIQVQHLRTGKRWLGISVDSQLEYSSQRSTGTQPAMKADVEILAVNEFLKAWGIASYSPIAAYRLAPAADWSLATKPREPLVNAEPSLALSFDRERVEIDFTAQLTTSAGYVFQYRLLGPKELSVQSISLKKDGIEMAGRWSHDSNGVITVFLTGPAEGRQELKLHGTMPLAGQSTLPLPAPRIEGAGSESMLVQIYRRPGVLVEVTPPLGATPPSFLGQLQRPFSLRESPAPVDFSSPKIMSDRAGEHERDLTERGRLVRAYRVSEKSPSLGEVALKPNDPVFKAKQLLTLNQEDRQWRATVDCRIQVVQGVVDEFQFDVSPSWTGPYTLSTNAAIEAVDLPGSRRRLTVAPPQAIAGEYNFSISGLLKFLPGERPTMPEIALRQAQELSRFAALPKKLQGQETHWEINSLNVVKMPDFFPGAIDPQFYDICEATGGNPQAVLRQQEQNSASPQVGLADIQLAWQTDGSWRAVATFELTPGGTSTCPLQLPQGCELIAVEVDGMPVQPQSPKQGEWSINLNSDRLPQRVAVVYRGTIPAADRPGTHEFAAPTLGEIPVAKTLWTVAGPSRFSPGEFAEKEPTDTLNQQWIRFREIAGAIEQSAGLLSEDNEETRRWYQLHVRYWASARSALLRQWLPISQTLAGRTMRQEMESLDQRQSQFAEHLEMSDVLRQLLAASPQAYEPADWWQETLFDLAAASAFEQTGRLTSLQLNYASAEKSQTLERFWAVLGIAGLLALVIWGIRKNYWIQLHRFAPSVSYAAVAALGLLWWLCLAPSWLGLGIVLVSVASWGRSRKNLRPSSP